MWWSGRSSKRPHQGIGAGPWGRRKRLAIDGLLGVVGASQRPKPADRLPVEGTGVEPHLTDGGLERNVAPSVRAVGVVTVWPPVPRLEDEVLPLPLSLALPRVMGPAAWFSVGEETVPLETAEEKHAGSAEPIRGGLTDAELPAAEPSDVGSTDFGPIEVGPIDAKPTGAELVAEEPTDPELTFSEALAAETTEQGLAGDSNDAMGPLREDFLVAIELQAVGEQTPSSELEEAMAQLVDAEEQEPDLLPADGFSLQEGLSVEDELPTLIADQVAVDNALAAFDKTTVEGTDRQRVAISSAAVYLELGGAAMSGTFISRPVLLELDSVVAPSVVAPSVVAPNVVAPSPSTMKSAESSQRAVAVRDGAIEDADPEAALGMGPYQNAPGAEDTQVGEISVEQQLELDEGGPASATVDLDVAADPADVVAEGGAIRVALSLGTRAPTDRKDVTRGVAVGPAEAVASSVGRSGDILGLGATDLVKLARLKDKLGGPGVRVDALVTEDALPAVGLGGDADDWLGLENEEKSQPVGGVSPLGEDDDEGA